MTVHFEKISVILLSTLAVTRILLICVPKVAFDKVHLTKCESDPFFKKL